MLDEMLERWRSTPDPLLADAIDVVSEQQAPPGFEGTLAAKIDAARDAVASQDEAALPAILDAALQQRSIDEVSDLLDMMLEHWPRDPRLVTAFSSWLEAPRWTSQRSRRIWGRAFKLMARTPDVRLMALEALEPERGFPGATSDWVAQRRDKVLGKVRFPESAATAAERAAWQAIVVRDRAAAERERRARAELEGLRDAVLADPADRDLRRVYADALTELGDPRGKLILLQLAQLDGTLDRSGKSRIRKLVKQHGSEWLGPMDAVFLKSGRVWEGGFLVEGAVKPKNLGETEAALGLPEWAMLREVDLRGSQGMGHRGVELVTQPVSAGLVAVRGIQTGAELGQLLEAPCAPTLTLLGLRCEYWPVAPGDVPSGAFPAVRSLELDAGWCACLEPLGGIASELERVLLQLDLVPITYGTNYSPADAVDVLSELERLASEVRIEIRRQRFLTLEIGLANGQLHADVHYPPKLARTHHDAVLQGVRALLRRGLDSLTIDERYADRLGDVLGSVPSVTVT